MFISTLNSKQQAVLLALAESIVAADGIVQQDEEQMLMTLKAQCESGVVKAELSILELERVFDTQEAKSALMLELLGVAFADADYHATEKAKITEIANALKIDAMLLSDMESWVSRQFVMVKEAYSFMEEA